MEFYNPFGVSQGKMSIVIKKNSPRAERAEGRRRASAPMSPSPSARFKKSPSRPAGTLINIH